MAGSPSAVGKGDRQRGPRAGDHDATYGPMARTRGHERSSRARRSDVLDADDADPHVPGLLRSDARGGLERQRWQPISSVEDGGAGVFERGTPFGRPGRPASASIRSSQDGRVAMPWAEASAASNQSRWLGQGRGPRRGNANLCGHRRGQAAEVIEPIAGSGLRRHASSQNPSPKSGGHPGDRPVPPLL